MIRLKPLVLRLGAQNSATNIIRYSGTCGPHAEKLSLRETAEKIDNILSEYSPSGQVRKQASETHQHEGIQVRS